MNNQSFEEQCRIEQRCRQDEWYWQNHCNNVRGIHIYTDFCVWCNCYADKQTKTNVSAFKKWLKENNIELTPYQSRYLLENKFGYKVWYDEKQKDWRCEKV